MDQPKEFEKSPLVDAVLEIRFEPPENADIVPGLVYSKLRKEFGIINELPGLQIPLYIRLNDPGLKYQATHRLETDDYYILVGPTVLAVGCKITPGEKKYPGWVEFSKKFQEVVQEVMALEFIGGVTRLGCRYINLFQRHDLFSDLNISLETGWQDKVLQEDRVLGIIIANGNYKSRLTINTNVVTKDLMGNETIRQLLDVDTSIETDDLTSKLKTYSNKAHAYTEEVFFKLLKDKIKEDLGAKYE